MDTKKPKDKDKSAAASYAKYSGIAFQFIGVIVLSTWGGHWLDHKIGIKFPAFTLTFAIVSAAMAIYLLIKQLK